MKVVVIALFGLALVLAGCGGSGGTRNSSNAASGFWSVTLNSAAVPPAAGSAQFLTFTMSMNQSGNTLTGSNVNINETNTCFGPGSTISGQLTMGVMGQGNEMQMTMVSAGAPGAQNALTMTGAMSAMMNGASGSFTLTGVTPGCVSTTGTFTMVQQLHK